MAIGHKFSHELCGFDLALLGFGVSGGGGRSHFGGPVGATPRMLVGGDRTPVELELVSRETMLTGRQRERRTA